VLRERWGMGQGSGQRCVLFALYDRWAMGCVSVKSKMLAGLEKYDPYPSLLHLLLPLVSNGEHNSRSANSHGDRPKFVAPR
jgi:hypothetical protein